MRCKEENKETLYFGESARTCFDRGLEHQSAIDKLDKESPLVEHHVEDHPDHAPWFSMKLKSVHNQPLHRQCEEAHLIEGFSGFKIMNRKGEWGQNLPPKLSIEGTDHQVKRGRANDHRGGTPSELTTSEPPERKKRRKTDHKHPAKVEVTSQKHASANLKAKKMLEMIWVSSKAANVRNHCPSNNGGGSEQVKSCCERTSNAKTLRVSATQPRPAVLKD